MSCKKDCVNGELGRVEEEDDTANLMGYGNPTINLVNDNLTETRTEDCYCCSVNRSIYASK